MAGQERGSEEEPAPALPSCLSARGPWSTSSPALTTAQMILRLASLVLQADGAMLRARVEMDVTISVVEGDTELRLLWSMRSVTANLFGVARSSANSAREGNSITPATEINMLSVSQQYSDRSRNI